MNTTFQTKSDAIAAGFTAPRGNTHFRGFVIRHKDTSGATSYGYRLSLVIRPAVEIYDALLGDLLPLMDKSFADTETVWMDAELNAIRQPGAFAPMYAPGDVDNGIQAAVQAIDAWYRAHPEAEAAHEEWALWRAECDARQAAKTARWEAKKAARAAGGLR